MGQGYQDREYLQDARRKNLQMYKVIQIFITFESTDVC